MPHSRAQLSGIGEFTFRSDWAELLRRFDDLGVEVTLVSNFARPLSDADFDALLKLKHLMVSLDTVDAELLRKFRELTKEPIGDFIRSPKIEGLWSRYKRYVEFLKSTPNVIVFRYEDVIFDKRAWVQRLIHAYPVNAHTDYMLIWERVGLSA
jgi:hypothetical protein